MVRVFYFFQKEASILVNLKIILQKELDILNYKNLNNIHVITKVVSFKTVK